MERRGFISSLVGLAGAVVAGKALASEPKTQTVIPPPSLKALIAESGSMWEGARGRSTSAVLVKLDQSNLVYELTIPTGKRHPDWNIKRRMMTDAESKALVEARKTTWAQEVGEIDPHLGYRCRAFIYNGRAADKWLPSFDRSTKG